MVVERARRNDAVAMHRCRRKEPRRAAGQIRKCEGKGRDLNAISLHEAAGRGTLTGWKRTGRGGTAPWWDNTESSDAEAIVRHLN
jgi:hypothetical protein